MALAGLPVPCGQPLVPNRPSEPCPDFFESLRSSWSPVTESNRRPSPYHRGHGGRCGLLTQILGLCRSMLSCGPSAVHGAQGRAAPDNLYGDLAAYLGRLRSRSSLRSLVSCGLAEVPAARVADRRRDLPQVPRRRPVMPMSVRCVSVYLCTHLHVDYLDGDRQFSLVVRIGARRLGVVDDYVYRAGCGVQIIR